METVWLVDKVDQNNRFQKDLVVWKPNISRSYLSTAEGVSEGLSSVETYKFRMAWRDGAMFQKDLVVWKPTWCSL